MTEFKPSLRSFPDEEIQALVETYHSSHVITIPNFCQTDSADNLSQSINNFPDSDWSVSIHPYLPNTYTFYNNEMNQGTIAEGKKSAQHAYDLGHFSYFFYRKDPHDNCQCELCQTVSFLKSSRVLDLINRITGEDVTQTISLFASRYKAGCFLNTHTDTGRGKIAFVLNLTKDWDATNGGCLNILDWDHQTVVHNINPTFNSLTIFRVVGQGIPHKVTRIKDEVIGNRIAISGWFV